MLQNVGGIELDYGIKTTDVVNESSSVLCGNQLIHQLREWESTHLMLFIDFGGFFTLLKNKSEQQLYDNREIIFREAFKNRSTKEEISALCFNLFMSNKNVLLLIGLLNHLNEIPPLTINHTRGIINVLLRASNVSDEVNKSINILKVFMRQVKKCDEHRVLMHNIAILEERCPILVRQKIHEVFECLLKDDEDDRLNKIYTDFGPELFGCYLFTSQTLTLGISSPEWNQLVQKISDDGQMKLLCDLHVKSNKNLKDTFEQKDLALSFMAQLRLLFISPKALYLYFKSFLNKRCIGVYKAMSTGSWGKGQTLGHAHPPQVDQSLVAENDSQRRVRQ